MDPANAAADPRRLLLDGLSAALDATAGRESVRRRLAAERDFAPRFAFAVGKAAPAMMAGAFDALGTGIERALVVTKHGHAGDVLDRGSPVEVVESSHPVPDDSCLAAGRALVDFVDAIPAGADALALVSGGASALVEVLPEGFDASDLARVNEYLLAAGHPIGAVNRVRKRISRIKGGRLAQRLAARRTLNLAISDVPGDDLRVIGSGLLVFHSSEDIAIDGLDLPPWLTAMGHRAPPLSGEEATSRVRTEIVARSADARAAAAAAYRAAGVDVVEHRNLLEGDAPETGRRIGREITHEKPAAHVWASETTVTLPPESGTGRAVPEPRAGGGARDPRLRGRVRARRRNRRDRRTRGGRGRAGRRGDRRARNGGWAGSRTLSARRRRRDVSGSERRSRAHGPDRHQRHGSRSSR